MPLLDHFHPPHLLRRHWEGFHGEWASVLVNRLNHKLLPQHYYAEPHIHVGTEIEVDVATFEEVGNLSATGNGSATAVWAPARPKLHLPIDFSALDTFEVRVFSDEGGSHLKAAIELVSPGNKDRPSNRRAFLIKCISYLQQGVSVIIIDVATSRKGSFHPQLLQELQPGSATVSFPDLYATSYRTIVAEKTVYLDCWPEPLALGQQLPTLPLWLASDFSVPIDLEQSYIDTCENLRIKIDP